MHPRRISTVCQHIRSSQTLAGPDDIQSAGLPFHKRAPPAGSPERVEDGIVTKAIRPFLYFLFHHMRLFGWIPAGAIAAVMAPRKTALVAAVYVAVHRQDWWQKAMHAAYGTRTVQAFSSSTESTPQQHEASPLP